MKDMLLMMQIECLIFLVPIALLFVAITALVIWCTVATCAVTVFNFVTSVFKCKQ